MNKKMAQKQIDKAVKKQVTAPVRKPVDNLLVLVLVLDRRTGKVVSFKECNSVSNNKVTVDNSVENSINILDAAGYDVVRKLT